MIKGLSELQSRTTWPGRLERSIATAKAHHTRHLRVRVFGTPSKVDERLLEVAKVLDDEGYEVKGLDQKLLSMIFRVVDVHLERSVPG